MYHAKVRRNKGKKGTKLSLLSSILIFGIFLQPAFIHSSYLNIEVNCTHLWFLAANYNICKRDYWGKKKKIRRHIKWNWNLNKEVLCVLFNLLSFSYGSILHV